MKIHVIGVGKMGLPMARHLLAAGHAVTVEDPSAERLALAREAGLSVADGLGAAEVVVSSLPHDGALLAVGERGDGLGPESAARATVAAAALLGAEPLLAG